MTGLDRLRGYARRMDELHVWPGGARLRDIADQIEREHAVADKKEHDAATWVREYGGLDSVKKLLDWVVGHGSTKQQLDFDFWLSGRVMHELGFDEDTADRDEVERRLLARLMPEGMAWPRFEDGEPVRIGDEISWRDEGGAVNSIELQDGGYFTLHAADGAQDWILPQYFPGERVKRPAPKVLDADGVEIEVGDDLYSVEGMLKFHVSAIDKKGGRIATEAMFALDKWADPKMYTHRAPVLAADGEPLEVGQTVWRDDGEMLEVLYLRPDGLVDCCGEIERPERLTHQRPVLDAEGNRIEPAMDVWWVCEGDERGIHAEKLHVESIGEDGLVTCDPFNGGTWVELEPSELYVKKPVLDADGAPIHEGDTVYDKDTGDRFEVDGFSYDGVVCTDIDACESDIEILPSQLTHAKPEIDTWERIEEDAGCTATKYNERRGTIFTTKQQVARDLVRRCRALAVRGQ